MEQILNPLNRMVKGTLVVARTRRAGRPDPGRDKPVPYERNTK